MLSRDDRQERDIARIRTALLQYRRVVYVAPTGSGKSWVCGKIVARAVKSGRRALWLCHRAELVDQSAAILTRLGLTVGGLCAGAMLPPNPYAQVQVASVQTLLARRALPPADIVIADECHHFCEAAAEFNAVIEAYTDALIIGATATPERGDGSGLRGAWDGIVLGPSVRELTDAGELVPCQVVRPDSPLGPCKIAQSPVDAYLEHAPGRRAIVFCRSVPLAQQYADEFTARGIDGRCITNETPWAERRLYIEAFRRGKIQVLTNVYCLTEGFDAPEMSCIIVARGCSSSGMYLQMIGRALRIAPDKVDAMVLDLRGVSYAHGLPEDERSFSLDGKGIRLSDPNRYCQICGLFPESCVCEYKKEDQSNKPDRITGDPLVKYARKRAESDEQRVRSLARWIATARANSYKEGWWYMRFRIVYGTTPSRELVQAARRLSA